MISVVCDSVGPREFGRGSRKSNSFQPGVEPLSRARYRPRASPRPVEALEGRMLLSLAAAGEPFRVNAPEDVFDFFPTVAMDADGDSVASWFHINEDFSDGWPVARMFDPQGNPKGPEFQVNTLAYAQNEPHVDMNDDGSFEIAYLGNSLFVRSYDAAGNPRGPEFPVNEGIPGYTAGGGVPYVDIASLSGGGFVIAWKQSFDDGTGGLFARRYGPDDQPAGPAYRVDDVAAQPAGMDVQVAVNDKDEVLVAWRNRPNNVVSNLGDLYGRVFSNVDVPAGPAFVIDAGGDHSVPAISAAKKDFFVAWRDSGGVHGEEQTSIRARRYDRHGRPLGAPILVESNVPASRSAFSGGPYIEASPDGRFAVSWVVNGTDYSQPGTAYLRQYDAAGQPVSGTVTLGSGADSDGLGGFAADDNLTHGLLVWMKRDSSIGGQFVADPGAAAAAASSSGSASGDASASDAESTAATDLLYA